MTTPAQDHQPLRTINFRRYGPNAFEGKFFIRGTQFDNFRLESSVGRIPQDAVDAVAEAQARLADGQWPEAYLHAIDALARVSDDYMCDHL
jgi:hypothetical protein